MCYTSSCDIDVIPYKLFHQPLTFSFFISELDLRDSIRHRDANTPTIYATNTELTFIVSNAVNESAYLLRLSGQYLQSGRQLYFYGYQYGCDSSVLRAVLINNEKEGKKRQGQKMMYARFLVEIDRLSQKVPRLLDLVEWDKRIVTPNYATTIVLENVTLSSFTPFRWHVNFVSVIRSASFLHGEPRRVFLPVVS